MVELGQVQEQAPKDLIGFLDFYLVKKAPVQIPANAKEWLVRYGPWILVVLLVITLPAALVVLGLGAIVAPFVLGFGGAAGFGILGLGLIVQFALEVAALPGLFARRMSGWKLLFYAQIVSIATSLLSGSIVFGLIAGLISLYVLFQVRTLYQ